MSIATDYIVRTRYEVDPKSAEAALGRVVKSADQAAHSADSVKRALLGIGTAVIGGDLLGKAKDSLITFNSNMEQAKLTMSGLVTLVNGGSVDKNMSAASNMVDRLQQRSKATTSTTAELVEMASLITEPVLQAGGSMKDLENFTVGASVAAKALGRNTQYASLEITEALQGNWTKRMSFLNAILLPTGITHEKFNALGAAERFQLVSKALNAKGLRELAEAQRNSFAGVTSTLKDNLEIALGRVGLPLFKAMSAEIGRWNDWLDKHPQQLEAIVKSLSGALVSGFSMVKSAMEFVWQNREVIADLAKAALIWKAGKVAGGLLGGLAGRLGEAGGSPLFKTFGELGKDAKGVSSAFRSIQAAAGPLIGAFAAGYGIGSMILAAYNRTAAEDKKENQRQGPLADAIYEMDRTSKAQQARLAVEAQTTGLLRRSAFGKGMVVDAEALAAAVGRSDEYRMRGQVDYVESTKEMIIENRLLRYSVESWRAQISDLVGTGQGIVANTLIASGLEKIANATSKRPPNTQIGTVNIQMEAAKDPDRWLVVFNRKLTSVARLRTRPRKGLRGGGT